MYKLKMLLLFIMLICVFDKVDAFIKEAPLMGKIIYLDAGHGRYSYVLVQYIMS